MTSLICKVGWNSHPVRTSRGVGKHHEIVSDRPRSISSSPFFCGGARTKRPLLPCHSSC